MIKLVIQGSGRPASTMPRTARAISRSSRASRTSTRTGELAAPRSVSPPEWACCGSSSSSTPRNRQAGRARARTAAERSPTPPVKTSASSRQAQRPSRRSRPAAGAGTPRRPGSPRAPPRGRAGEHHPHVRCAGQRHQPGGVEQALGQLGRAVIPASVCSHSSRPGSTVPDRVAITRPSSGVNPMVVSTHVPSRTAASEAPDPKWHVTTGARPVSSVARRDA